MSIGKMPLDEFEDFVDKALANYKENEINGDNGFVFISVTHSYNFLNKDRDYNDDHFTYADEGFL